MPWHSPLRVDHGAPLAVPPAPLCPLQWHQALMLALVCLHLLPVSLSDPIHPCLSLSCCCHSDPPISFHRETTRPMLLPTMVTVNQSSQMWSSLQVCPTLPTAFPNGVFIARLHTDRRDLRGFSEGQYLLEYSRYRVQVGKTNPRECPSAPECCLVRP